eukprot:261584-Alexandrium_andersonii.AAC.1
MPGPPVARGGGRRPGPATAARERRRRAGHRENNPVSPAIRARTAPAGNPTAYLEQPLPNRAPCQRRG